MADRASENPSTRIPSTDPELKDTDEVEIKILTQRGKDDFKTLIDALQEAGVYMPPAWSKELHSIYFDTEKQDLNQNGRALRIRYEFDENGKRRKLPDLSTKSLGQAFGHGVRRTELETAIPTIKLDLNALYDEYKDDKDALAYLDEMTDIISRDPHSLREIFAINCTRMNFKAALALVTDNNGKKTILPHAAANDNNDSDTKRIIFEFSLDHSRFLLHSFGTKETLFLGEDFEIESELKTQECMYDPQPCASSPGLTADDVILAQKYITDIIRESLDPDGLDWTGKSKQERGFSLREAFEKVSGSLPLAKKPSYAGKPLPVTDLQPEIIKRKSVPKP